MLRSTKIIKPSYLILILFWLNPFWIQNVSHAGFLDFSSLTQSCRNLLLFVRNPQGVTASSLFSQFKTDRNLQTSLHLLSLGATEALEAERFINDLFNLPVNERRIFSQFFTQFPKFSGAISSAEGNLFSLIRLALQDEEEWAVFLELNQNTRRTHYRFIPRIDFISRMLATMAQDSPELLTRFARLVPENYRSQKTLGYIKGKYLRRIYDLILKLKYPAGPFFVDEISKGRAPEIAYGKYIESVNDTLQDPSRVFYSGNDVLHVVTDIQKWLQSLPASLNPLQLTLFGSFPNGKADLATSDIDLDFTVIGEKTKTPHKILGSRLSEFQKPLLAEIKKTLKSRTENEKITISFVQLKNELTYPGIINSVAFRITVSRIELIIYDGGVPVIYPILKDQ